LRIAYVLTCLGIGGAERQVIGLAERIAARGHVVVLISVRAPRAEEWPTSLNVVYLKFRKNPFSAITGCIRAVRFLRAFRPDWIHGNNFHGNLVTRLLKLVIPMAHIVSTIHNVYEGGRARMLAYRLSDPLSDGTTAVSQAVADKFIELKAVPMAKLIVLSNGIDTELFSPSLERHRETRIWMGAKSDFIWLAVGRIVPAKDYPNLLAAFRLVKETIPETRLWIAGEQSGRKLFKSDGRLVDIDDFGDDSVQWLGLRRDMAALLDAADGFVLSSAWEGMPLALGEAMAMEKPVVSTDVGGVRELVGDTGLVVPPKDAAALARAMIAVMRTSVEDRKTRGRAGRDRIVSMFSMKTRAVAWESYYAGGLRG